MPDLGGWYGDGSVEMTSLGLWDVIVGLRGLGGGTVMVGVKDVLTLKWVVRLGKCGTCSNVKIWPGRCLDQVQILTVWKTLLNLNNCGQHSCQEALLYIMRLPHDLALGGVWSQGCAHNLGALLCNAG